ncbi:ribbon-helix-helix domain-containing protein [Altererythrobacter sp. CAU 1778]
MPAPYHPPVKRSIRIEGHSTSISLEPMFWQMLKGEAERADTTINGLVARIDEERIRAENPCGLAVAIRIWLVHRLRDQ